MHGYCPRRAACPRPHFTHAQMLHYQQRPQDYDRLVARHLAARDRGAAIAAAPALRNTGASGSRLPLERFTAGPPVVASPASDATLPQIPAEFEGMDDVFVPGSAPLQLHIGGILIDAVVTGHG
jgi:hypothetical protein